MEWFWALADSNVHFSWPVPAPYSIELDAGGLPKLDLPAKAWKATFTPLYAYLHGSI
jgi:hypothetical protein